MRARAAKKMLKALLSRQLDVLQVPPGGALVLKYDARHYEGRELSAVSNAWSQILGVPVLPCPNNVDVQAVTRGEGEGAQ